MKQATLAGMVLMLFVTAWTSVPAGGEAASAEPAPAKVSGGASADMKPAATTKKPATSPASGDDKDEQVPRALLKAARASFVVVETWYKKDLSEPSGGQERNWRVERMCRQYIDKKRPEEGLGVVVDDRGHVLITDTALEDRFLKRIVVRTPAGEGLPAKRVKLLYDAPGVMVKVSQADAAKLKPLEFSPLKDAGLDTKLMQANLYKVDDRWRIRVGPLKPSASYSPAPEKSDNVFFGYRGRGYPRGYAGAVSIVSDADGAPVGCSLAPFLDLRQDECLWKGPDLLKAEGIAWEQFRALKKKTRESLTAAVQEVVIKIRRSQQEFPSGSDEHSYGGGGAAGREISAYGFAISDTDILLPLSLDSKTAAMIDKIYVKFSPRVRKPAQFVCAYKGFAAFVVRLEKGKLPAQIVPAKADLPRMRPFWVARARKRQGKKYVDLTTNRIFGRTRGYAGKYHWYAAGELKQGAILVDFAGNVAGMHLPERLENEEARSLQRTGRYYGPQREVRIFTISELRAALRAPLAHRDTKIKVKTSTQAKRRAWLGVEFVAMHNDLAEQMKVEGPTKDGRIGLLVNAVYAASPAEKLGLKVGDILLRIEAPGMPYPIELDRRFAGEGDYGYRRRWGRHGGGSGATWKQRRNPLTLAMDKIGIAKTIKITYYRMDAKDKGKVTVVNYKIAQAPTDQDSAPKWKNRKLGLTVKDITYEVRHALNLKADGGAPGVVVSKIEPGSPTLIARIFPTEIITRAGDVPLKSARQLRDLIAVAHKAGKKKIRLAVLRLGKTRFADLTISDYDASDDEGLDEEDGKKDEAKKAE